MSGQVSLIDGHIDNENRCACCHRIIPEGSHYCIICGDVPKRKKQRQIDRIRNMSVEELASLFKQCDCGTPPYCSCKNGICEKDCFECAKRYLESEVDSE
jgi:hypothetical protein